VLAQPKRYDPDSLSIEKPGRLWGAYMKKIPVYIRVLILLSVIWLFITIINYMGLRGFSTRYIISCIISYGVVPLVILWGIIWIVAGVRKKKIDKE